MRILDLNDNKPEFARKFYQFYIEENLSNTTLRDPSIEVYDFDTIKRNSLLHFQIVERSFNSSNRESDHIRLQLPSVSKLNLLEHVIVLNTETNYPLLHIYKPFDFERHDSNIEFDLVAYDIDNFTDSAHVVIRVLDLNDNAPIFINENATFVIKENLPSNSFIGQARIFIFLKRLTFKLNLDLNKGNCCRSRFSWPKF